MTNITPECLSEEEAAVFLGVGRSTLANRRRARKLPDGIWVYIAAKRLVYRVSLLRRWLDLGCPDAWPAGEPVTAA